MVSPRDVYVYHKILSELVYSASSFNVSSLSQRTVRNKNSKELLSNSLTAGETESEMKLFSAILAIYLALLCATDLGIV